jgi:integrase
MVAVLIYAGLRREELLWLTLDDVQLSSRQGGNGLIRVQAKTIETDAGPRSWQPKTKVNRAVPISSTLRNYLDRYTPPASNESAGGGWFFPAPTGGWWDPDNFSGRALRQANTDANLRWTCLDYRHTFGSQLAQRGVSLYKISALMGNSPEICWRHYASLIPEAMGDEVEFGQPLRSFELEAI